ncbi:hypothetical protein RDWZM_007103 [Blomia tropicalis]|uniref:Kazal-like domain-containing protein n=1 Tax=Blomia tropicalis TaxID=40697 RepID=A0A9Q0RPW5_BLOTA|nr:hypothetical protein RDWZM_007103 [Blomia tropicalis]
MIRLTIILIVFYSYCVSTYGFDEDRFTFRRPRLRYLMSPSSDDENLVEDRQKSVNISSILAKNIPFSLSDNLEALLHQTTSNADSRWNFTQVNLANAHLSLMRTKYSCLVPRPKLVKVLDYHPSASKQYVPRTHRCGPSKTEMVHLYFHVIWSDRKNNITGGSASGIDRLTFLNHTKCEYTNQLEDIVCNNETLEAPICASNGQVFETECQMKRTNLSLTKSDWEVCRGLHPLCPEDCLDIQDPVCAEDGKVHPNKCVMHRRNCGRRISERPMIFCLGSHRKSRTQNQCPDSCLELHQPVCGSDGQIYLNECYLRMMNCKNGVEKMKMEMCVTPPSCPVSCIPIYDPVCNG